MSHYVELQPLNLGQPDFSADAFGDGGGPPRQRRHYGQRGWTTQLISDPQVQRRVWIGLGLLVVVAAGVIFAATSTRHNQHVEQQSDDKGAAAAADATKAFPAEPFLAPRTTCQLLDAASASVGPELQLAVPLNYHLQLNLSDPAFYKPGDATGRVAAGFGGSVNITLHVAQDAPCISLHARNLSFSSISARLIGAAAWKEGGASSQQQQQQQQTGVCLCGASASCLTNVCARLFKARPGSEAWVISLGPYVAPAGSTLVLQATYTAAFGAIGKQGLWRSAAYPSAAAAGSSSGVQPQVVALSTEFEMNAARTVLPCLDQPGYKATFVVEVDAPSQLAVLSNAPSASTRWTLSSADSSVSRVTFQPTPPMSTYLLSIAVGELKAMSSKTKSGQAVRVWTTPESVAAAAMPLQLAVAALDHYQQLTGMLQSSGSADTKWDLAAVPGKTGAVENWSLLMMDPERFLLTPPSGAWDLFRCANVICHELGHQWLGNLVTAASWPDLLVNEGLATLAEYGCLAAVLPQQVGLQGAAVLMRGMFGPPAGVVPGVHEGPFEKTLSYDASPLAQPLLGAAGEVAFGVPVYSKAASLMAMVSHYAALAGPAGANTSSGVASTQQLQFGPVADLRGSTPPSPLQEALRQHLEQHAYSTATAQETLARIVQLAPPDLSSNTLAVVTGWQSPGSPLIALQHTAEGLKLTVKRFCAWGLLQDNLTTQLLAAAGGGGSTPATSPAHLPTPPAATQEADGSSSSSSALYCPTAVEGFTDRAVPWTPVSVTLLPNGHLDSDSTSNTSNTSSRSDSSSDAGGFDSRLCGQWVVVSKDEQLVAPTAAACPGAAAAVAHQDSPGYVLDGVGGWGVYRSTYPPTQRAALRRWVVGYVQQQLGGDGAAGAGAAAAGNSSSSISLEHLLSASKMLQDQAALGLSAFGEGQGVEVLAVLQAAANASMAAAAAATATGTGGSVGFGTVLYTLLAPVVPAAEVLVDRVATDRVCWVAKQEHVGSALVPVAAAALSAFASAQPNNSSSSSMNTSAAVIHHTPDQFLGAMTLNRLLTATAMLHAETANKLCNMFNAAAAAAVAAGGGSAVDADGLLSGMHPDLHHAVLDVAAAQPPGCQLDWAGDKLYATLQEWYISNRNPRIATMAAFALAHFPARGFHSSVTVADTLALLLALNSTTAQGSAEQPSPQNPASGISPAKHAVELAVLVSRAVTLSTAGSTDSPNSNSPGPVLAVLLQQWQQLEARLGDKTAWDVLREVAAREVLTQQQWHALAAWAVQQVPAADSTTGAGGGGVGKVQRRRGQALLGAAWSTVAWVQVNKESVCRS